MSVATPTAPLHERPFRPLPCPSSSWHYSEREGHRRYLACGATGWKRSSFALRGRCRRAHLTWPANSTPAPIHRGGRHRTELVLHGLADRTTGRFLNVSGGECVYTVVSWSLDQSNMSTFDLVHEALAAKRM